MYTGGSVASGTATESVANILLEGNGVIDAEVTLVSPAD